MGHHAVERLIGAVGQRELDDFHLVELVQTVQTAHVLAVGACLAAEAGGVGGHLDREVLLVENHVAVDVRHGHFGRWNHVEVVDRGVVHLLLLVGQLAGAEARRLVDHHRRLDLQIAGLGVAVEEVVDERALQTGALSLVDGESGAGELHAQVEVDDVVLAGQLPVGQCILGQLGVALDELDHQVVGRRASLGDDVGGEVGQRDDGGLQLLGHLLGLGVEACRLLLESGDEALALLGLLAAALAHQHANLLGRLVLGCERVVELDLDGLAAVVELLDFGNDRGCIHALLGEFADGGLGVFSQLLDCKHGIFVLLCIPFSVCKISKNRLKVALRAPFFGWQSLFFARRCGRSPAARQSCGGGWSVRPFPLVVPGLRRAGLRRSALSARAHSPKRGHEGSEA